MQLERCRGNRNLNDTVRFGTPVAKEPKALWKVLAFLFWLEHDRPRFGA
jgi:hypothetical protein